MLITWIIIVAIIVARNYEMVLFCFNDIVVGDDRRRLLVFFCSISVIVVSGAVLFIRRRRRWIDFLFEAERDRGALKYGICYARSGAITVESLTFSLGPRHLLRWLFTFGLTLKSRTKKNVWNGFPRKSISILFHSAPWMPLKATKKKHKDMNSIFGEINSSARKLFAWDVKLCACSWNFRWCRLHYKSSVCHTWMVA